MVSANMRRICAFLIAALILAIQAQGVFSPPASGQQHATKSSAVLLEITGAIGPATTLYLRDGFEEADRRNARLIILQMDTPGGLDAAMRDIISQILRSPIPVLTYVSPSGARAASAGTYILYSSHLAAMAPGTHLGAATPVQLGGGSRPARDRKDEAPTTPDAARAKAINDAVAYIRGLAGLHNRNADWAERAVRDAATLPARDALERGVVEIIASDLESALDQADGRTVHFPDGRAFVLSTKDLDVVSIEPDWRARMLSVITNPNVAYILLLVGIYGILFEFLSPGTIFSGVIGAIALLVALFALNLLPVNYAGIGLLVLGIGLLIAEVFSPSFGILGIGGAVALAVGSIFLFDAEIPGFTLSLSVVLIATAASALFVLIGMAAAVRWHRRQVITGDRVILDSPGRVLEWSGDRGAVLVHGERWQAHGPTQLAPGQRVRVTARSGLDLDVVPEHEGAAVSRTGVHDAD